MKLAARVAGRASWMLGLVLTVVLLGRTPGSPHEADAISVAFEGLRLGAAALAGYLFVLSAIGLAARVMHRAALVRLVEAWTLPPLRGCIRAVLGVTATVTLGLPGLATAERVPLTQTNEAPPVMVLEQPAAQQPPAEPPVTQQPATEPPVTPATQTWTVAAGDHFWHIAETALARSRGEAPTTGETASFWLELIEANRDRLVVRDEPDLIYPGQVLELPALASD